MRALLDTHTFLWWNLNSTKLSDTVKEIISDGRNDIFFSAVSGWEISIKYEKDRLTLPESPDEYVPQRVSNSRFTVLPILLSHTLQVHKLPDIHQDPFDRLLVAQGQLEHLPILTIDPEITKYNVDTIW